MQPSQPTSQQKVPNWELLYQQLAEDDKLKDEKIAHYEKERNCNPFYRRAEESHIFYALRAENLPSNSQNSESLQSVASPTVSQSDVTPIVASCFSCLAMANPTEASLTSATPSTPTLHESSMDLDFDSELTHLVQESANTEDDWKNWSFGALSSSLNTASSSAVQSTNSVPALHPAPLKSDALQVLSSTAPALHPAPLKSDASQVLSSTAKPMMNSTTSSK